MNGWPAGGAELNNSLHCMSLPDADAERLSLAGKVFRPACVRCGGAKKIEGVKTIAKVVFLYSMYIPSLSRRDRNRRTLNKMEGGWHFVF